jgi:hypothetical protein
MNRLITLVFLIAALVEGLAAAAPKSGGTMVYGRYAPQRSCPKAEV